MTQLVLSTVSAATGLAAVGSPLYDVSPEHVGALVAVALLPLLAWSLRRRAVGGDGLASRLVEAHRALPAARRFLVWLLASSAAIHLALAIGHGGLVLRLLFLADAALLALVARRLVLGRSWRARAALVLLGSIAGWWVSMGAGEPPDQVGLVTKLVEAIALALVVRPVSRGRLRAFAASAAAVTVVVLTGVAGWVGAFAASGVAHHDLGAFPVPGTVVSAVEDRPPTRAEREAAERLLAATAAGIAPYADPAVAAADGYVVEGMLGTDFHAGNSVYESDGRVLDPERPEALVYAQTPQGPVLLGALFVMEGLSEPGPAVGGPLTVWHAHENVCVSLIPPALSGLLSPLGGCPVGSINLPISQEMIHVWTVPGAPEAFGDLDEEWRAAYLAGFA